MKLEVVNIAKYRDGKQEGDDVVLALSGMGYGVFDGATDALGTVIEGIGAGRFAALTVAGSVARLLLDPAKRRMPIVDILAYVSDDLCAATRPLGLEIPPSTTMALALDLGEDWRFITLGDSAIRLNGTEILRFEKGIDDVSTFARVAIFTDLMTQAQGEDAAELGARRALMLGFDLAIAEGVLSAERAAAIIAEAIDKTKASHASAEIEAFLRGGIRTQYRYGNVQNHPLGFDTLNGTLPSRGEFIDVMRPKSAVESIEIFSDGYPEIPQGVSAQAWEAAFETAERDDYHKIGRWASVKGSTKDQFFDDRSVLILKR